MAGNTNLLAGYAPAATSGVATFDSGHTGSSIVLSSGNLKASLTGSGSSIQRESWMTLTKSTGLWYFELVPVWSGAISGYGFYLGIGQSNTSLANYPGRFSTEYAWSYDGTDSPAYQKLTNNTFATFGSLISSGNTVMFAVDFTNHYIYVGAEGTWFNSGVPTSGSSGTGAMYNFSSATYYFGIGIIVYASGTTGSVTKNGSTTTYTPPSGYSIL